MITRREAIGAAIAAAAIILSQMLALAAEPPVKVENGWVRAVPASSSDTAAFMTLTNTGDQPLRLTGGHTDLGGMLMPMITTRETKNGREVMGMKGVDSLIVAPHGKLLLAPGGDHLMIMGFKGPLRPGAKMKLTLTFASGEGSITVELPAALTQP